MVAHADLHTRLYISLLNLFFLKKEKCTHRLPICFALPKIERRCACFEFVPLIYCRYSNQQKNGGSGVYIKRTALAVMCPTICLFFFFFPKEDISIKYRTPRSKRSP